MFKLIFLFLLIISHTQLTAQITYASNQTFRVYSVNAAASIDIFFDAIPSSGTVVAVSANVNGVVLPATLVSGNQYKATWTTNSFGNYSLKGFMTTSTGAIDSTLLTTLKIIQVTNCPVPAWNSTTQYNSGDYVSHLGVLYTANFWTQGNIPGPIATEWTTVGSCSSQNYPNLDCSSIPVWDSTATYDPVTNSAIQVVYDNVIYRPNFWTNNNRPDHGGAWAFVGICSVLNEKPVIQSATVNSVITQPTLTTIPISAMITDVDGLIVYEKVIVNGNSLTPISSNGNNYTVNWLPPSYGIFPIQIIAIDDEQGMDTLNGTINIVRSIPPTISQVIPTNNQSIHSIYNLNSDVFSLSANVVDPDGTITNVTFTLNGQTFTYDNAVGNTYTYDWTPTSYGVYNLVVEGTDNSGDKRQYQSTFTLVDPLYESLTISNLPLQVQANLGYDKVFDLGEAITAIVVRNPALLTTTFSGSQLTISANKTGRTGLKITTASGVYYMGVRINDCNGVPPGMPDYASIGFKSQDIAADLQFWEDMDTNLTNKNMDVRYIYINGGPNISGTYNSWRDSTRTINYCRNSLKYGLIPFFVYYNIPDGAESFAIDLAHVQDTAYMKEYFQDLSNFMDHCASVMQGDLFGVLLEPDFLGYMQQLGVFHLGYNDPDSIRTCVSATTIAPNAGTIHSLVERINKTIDDKRTLGANVFFGWQLNLWSAGFNGGLGLMRRTDPSDLGWTAGRALIAQAATSTANYGMDAGILSHNANFISIDKYGLDAAGYSLGGVTANPWWFNHDHWDNYMMYAKTMHQVSGANMILWQLPVGRINNSQYQSAYTGSVHGNLTNTAGNYEDSSLDYFFGDRFTETDNTRFNHFTQNQALDSTISSINDTIIWEQHIKKFDECGIIHAMFGAGVSWSTDGIGNPPSDAYFSIQKIQEYYEDNLSYLSTAPYTSTTLTYGLTNTAVDLKLVHPGSFNFFGKGVSADGVFNPMLLGEGVHYVTFVVEENGCRLYKVQKIIIATNLLLSLPNTLMKFNATVVNNQLVELNWQTENEIDNDYFIIERSKHGVNWEPIAKVNGAGNTTTALTYKAKDDNPYTGISYYRLKQTSFNQEVNYSKIEAVEIEDLKEKKIMIYPNPTKNQLTIKGDKSELEILKIYNFLGQELELSSQIVSRKDIYIILDLSHLPTGGYIVKTKNTSNKIYKE